MARQLSELYFHREAITPKCGGLQSARHRTVRVVLDSEGNPKRDLGCVQSITLTELDGLPVVVVVGFDRNDELEYPLSSIEGWRRAKSAAASKKSGAK